MTLDSGLHDPASLHSPVQGSLENGQLDVGIGAPAASG